MRYQVPSFSTVVVLAALVASATTRAAPSQSVLSDSTYRLASQFGPDTLLIRELLFGQPVLGAEVDSSSGVLLVLIGSGHWNEETTSDSHSLFHKSDPEANRLVAYDLRKRRVLWEDSRKGTPIAASANRALLENGHHTDLIQLDDGRELASLGGTPILWRDGVALRVTDDAICRWDLDRAGDQWHVNREVGGAFSDVVREDSVAYLIADGIQKLDMHGGSLWAYSIRASRSGIYGVPGGGTVQMRTLFGGDRAEKLTARPLIQKPDIYFAAETTVVRLDSRSGIVQWRRYLPRVRGFSLKQRALGTPVTEQFLGNLVLRDAGDDLVAASLGWASGPKSSWIADPPSIALLAKSDGHVRARVQVPGVTFLQNVWSMPHRHYLLGSDRVMAMDDDLNVRATFRAPIGMAPLGEFVHIGDVIVVTTASGIAALSADSLKIVWSHPCGRMLSLERDVDWFGTRYFVTTQGLLRLDEGATGRPSAYYPLRGRSAAFRRGGVMMAAGARLRLVVLPGASPPERQD